ncbi:MAG: L,D-transpeptidase family protein [Bacillota bacterium]|nr:L,D-transpeptidase family protein [Bacillota bacterium]
MGKGFYLRPEFRALAWKWSLAVLLCLALPGEETRAAPTPAAEAAPPLWRIVINLPARTLALYEGGRLWRCYPIAVGKMVTPSAIGSYTVVNKVVNPTWYPEHKPPVPPGPDNPLGSRWLGLSLKGYGIHGTNDPSSIGKAVSGGCIRMHNQDVEELFALVPLGTPVEFIYETMLVEEAPDGEAVYLTVFPDIYRRGLNTPERAEQLLRQMGIREPFPREELARAVREARGEPVRLAVGVEIGLNGEPLGKRGFWAEEQVWVPLYPLAGRLNAELVWDLDSRTLALNGHSVSAFRVRGHDLYIPLPDAVAALGLGAEYNQKWGTLALSVPLLWVEGRLVGVRGRWEKGQVWWPVASAMRALGLGVTWDLSYGADWPHVPPPGGALEREGEIWWPEPLLKEKLGVQAIKKDPFGGLDLRPVQIWLDGEPLPSARAFRRGEELMVPVQAVAQGLGIEVRWEERRGMAVVGERWLLPAVVQLGRPYASLADFLRAVDGVAARWDEKKWVLELVRPAGVAQPLRGELIPLPVRRE